MTTNGIFFSLVGRGLLLCWRSQRKYGAFTVARKLLVYSRSMRPIRMPSLTG